MTIIIQFKRLLATPWIFGLAAGVFVIFFNLGLGMIVEGSLQGSYADYINNDRLVYLVPVSVAIQMSLYRHYRNLTANRILIRSEMIGVSGSVFTSVTLVACCVACCIEPVWSILPSIGLAMAASSFFMMYQEAIIIIALLVNVSGSLVLLMAIHKQLKK